MREKEREREREKTEKVLFFNSPYESIVLYKAKY